MPEIEDGVDVQFQPGGTYTTGDYWLIAARAAIEDIEWPQTGCGPAVRPPTGMDYANAPLALVDAAASFSDLRSTFGPLAKPVA